MEEIVKRLVDVIKQQVELFVLETGAFFPFGTCIDKDNKIKPIAAFLEDDNDSPSAIELICILEKYLNEAISERKYLIGAIAIDVVVKENGQDYDAVEIRFFGGNKSFRMHIKYNNQGNRLVFSSEVEF